MEPDRARYLFAGYLLTEPVGRDELDEGLPTPLLTASSCLARFVPDTWSLAWTGHTPTERQAAAAELGLSEEALRTVTDLVTAGFDDGRFGWPNVVLSRAGLVELLAQLPPGRPWVALGLALSPAHATRYLDWAAPRSPEEGAGGLHTLLARSTPLPPGGTVLGFEPLGFEARNAQPHSWYCNRLDLTFARTLGLRANAHGLLPTEDDAERGIAHIAAGAAPSEPGLWLPFLLLDYTPPPGPHPSTTPPVLPEPA